MYNKIRTNMWILKIKPFSMVFSADSSFLCSSRSVKLLFVEYAQVTKMLGNGRLEALCFDGAKRLCHIRGKLRKKVT